MPTPSNTIQIAELSQAYAFIEIEKQGLYGGGIDLKLPRKLFNIRRSIEWMYNLDPTESTLQGKSNYLYALCAPFNLKAEFVLSGGGGGGIAPVLPSASTGFLEFIVDDTTPIKAGDDTYIFNAAPYDWRGFEIGFVRDNRTEGRINVGSTYYSWTKATGVFQCVGAANTGEDFLFYVTI